jgi:ketosteroid isomerase-like protein
MKTVFLLSAIILACILLFCSQGYSTTTDTDKGRNTVEEEEIWTLEEAYFTRLYKADYEGVLAIVHSQFLGWPGAAPQPLDKEESARFMKKLAPTPTPCTCRIERAGIRLLGDVALTQYTLHVNCGDTAGAPQIPSSRITHTWVKEGSQWKLLGGMSKDR